MSKRTVLCLVNFSGQEITQIRISHFSGFGSTTNPGDLVEGKQLLHGDTLCIELEISNGGRSEYELAVTFADRTTLSFKDDQQKARVKHVGNIPHSGTARDLEVWRSSGGETDFWGTNGIYIRPKEDPDHSSWMRRLMKRKPEVRLHDLAMPGSHDAGMYLITDTLDPTTGSNPAWAQTQARSMARQLVAGARYFDLRIREYDDQLYTAHWSTSSKDPAHWVHYGAIGGHLNTVLNDVIAFLRSAGGNDEVVILRFSHTDKVDQAEVIDKIIEKVKSTLGSAGLLYASPGAEIDLPTTRLRALSGKVVAVFDSEFSRHWNVRQGIFPYYDETKAKGGGIPGLRVYDKYANKDRRQEMSEDQLHKLETDGGWGRPYLFVLSWTLSGNIGSGRVQDIEVLAGMANPWLPRSLTEMMEQGSRRPNVVLLDYVDPYLCGAIIAVNRLTEVRQFHAEQPWRHMYRLESQNDYGWELDGPAFYAFAQKEEGTVPIHEFYAKDPWRYLYRQEQKNDYGWTLKGTAFWAFDQQRPGTVAVNEFRAADNEPWRYKYSTRTSDHSGWVYVRQAFWAYPAKPRL